MPQDLGQFVGDPAFEMARGVLMEVCGCSATQAMVVFLECVEHADIDPEDLVARILADHTRPGVADLLGRHLRPGPNARSGEPELQRELAGGEYDC